MSGAQGIKASNSSWEGDFPRYGSSFRKVRVGYSIPCWSARWPCTPESPLPIEPAGIHHGFLVRHPFKSPFTPISQIAEGQLFEIWEYYLIFRRGWLGGWLLSAYVTALLAPGFLHTGRGGSKSPGSPGWRSLPGSKAFGLQQPTGYHLFTIHSYLLPSPTQVGDAGRVRALAYRYRVGSVSVCGTALPAPGFLHVSSRAG